MTDTRLRGTLPPDTANRVSEPDIVRFTSDYVRKLLAERHYVYARLYNQGGSVITQSTAADMERGEQYSSVIGSGIHNDLIDLAKVLETLPKADRDALLAWADDLTPAQAAQFLGTKGGRIKVISSDAIRQRRKRAVEKLTSELNDDLSGNETARGTSGRASDGSSPETEYQPEEAGRD